MRAYTSIFSSEIIRFLLVRQASESKSAYAHDEQVLELLDLYLCGIDCSNKELNEQQVMGWIGSLTGKTSSVANKVVIARRFFEYLSGCGIKAFMPRVPKVHDDYVPYIFSDEELCRIFSHADSLPPGKGSLKYTMMHIQLPMILRMMYGCGLRIGETLALKMCDTDLDTGVLTLQHPKGDKERIVPMHPSLTAILEKYCCASGLIGNPAPFIVWQTKQ